MVAWVVASLAHVSLIAGCAVFLKFSFPFVVPFVLRFIQ